MSFDLAQTFFLDSNRVQGASEVGITRLDLFFRAKPKATNNRSGIEYPGVNVFIVPTLNGYPLLTDGILADVEQISRREWNEILVSSAADIPTPFFFEEPVIAQTNREWTIGIKIDGHEDYIFWYNRVGENLVGTNVKSVASNDTQGKLFNYTSALSTNLGSNLGETEDGNNHYDDYIDPSLSPDQELLESLWKPLNGVDLKYRVYVARYAHNGVPVVANNQINDQFDIGDLPIEITNNSVKIIAAGENQEFFKFTQADSYNIESVLNGMAAYQPGPNFPGGTASPLTISVSNTANTLIANGSYIFANGSTFANSGGFLNIYNLNSDSYAIIDHGDEVEIKRIAAISSNTTILLDGPVYRSNNAAKLVVAPVGFVKGIDDLYAFGVQDRILTLTGSNANQSVRFVNNSINAISISNGGIGYTNGQYFEFGGYESVSGVVEGGYAAKATISTNSSGGVTALYFSNNGAGFVNVDNISVVARYANGSAVPTGTANGATFEYSVGSVIRFSEANSYIGNTKLLNLPIASLTPIVNINNPTGTSYTLEHGTNYYQVSDSNTYSGVAVYVDDTPEISYFTVQNLRTEYLARDQIAVYPSRSNQFNVYYSNGSVANSDVYGARLSNACYMTFELRSNNDFMSTYVIPNEISTIYTKYSINNDYTNEHTNYGNAYAKHVVTKVYFDEDRFSEDMLVYLTAYRPAGTDLKVYVRMHNSADYEAFDDKDWTLLEQFDGIGVYSSSTDLSDKIDLSYRVPQYPNTSVTISGTVETTNASANVVGVGTNFDTHLANNDLVKVYSPLFPNNYIIDVVQEVVNSTVITLSNDITNDNVLGPGFKVDKIGFPKQAFKNELNDKVIRYYNGENSVFDTYNTFQVKVVLLSNNETIVPRIGDIQSVGTSA